MIKLLQDALSLHAEAQVIIIQNPSCWIKYLSSNFAWALREFEWYFAKDRFLFAATAADYCGQWVCIINRLLAKYAGDEPIEAINEDIVKEDTAGRPLRTRSMDGFAANKGKNQPVDIKVFQGATEVHQKQDSFDDDAIGADIGAEDVTATKVILVTISMKTMMRFD